jgi:hypothetical protein
MAEHQRAMHSTSNVLSNLGNSMKQTNWNSNEGASATRYASDQQRSIFT